MVEGTRLESVRTLTGYRGFESPSLRQTESHLNMRLCYFCIKGVAGIMVNTDVYVPHLSEFYLTNKRDVRSNYIK